jgi:hypothetical protein
MCGTSVTRRSTSKPRSSCTVPPKPRIIESSNLVPSPVLPAERLLARFVGFHRAKDSTSMTAWNTSATGRSISWLNRKVGIVPRGATRPRGGTRTVPSRTRPGSTRSSALRRRTTADELGPRGRSGHHVVERHHLVPARGHVPHLHRLDDAPQLPDRLDVVVCALERFERAGRPLPSFGERPIS